MGPVVTEGSTVTVMVSSPYAGITRSGSYGRRPQAVLSAHSACAPASVLLGWPDGPHATLPPSRQIGSRGFHGMGGCERAAHADERRDDRRRLPGRGHFPLLVRGS